MDSVFCHANWAKSLSGISFPLLADFHPKGAVAQSFGLYLQGKGITDRATVIIDAAGTVRYAKSVTPAGERNMQELAAECEAVDAAYDGELEVTQPAAGIADGATLFVKNSCGFSRAVLLAVDNLRLRDTLSVLNVSDDASAMQTLEENTGEQQAPALLAGGDAIVESKDIINYLVSRTTTV